MVGIQREAAFRAGLRLLRWRVLLPVRSCDALPPPNSTKISFTSVAGTCFSWLITLGHGIHLDLGLKTTQSSSLSRVSALTLVVRRVFVHLCRHGSRGTDGAAHQASCEMGESRPAEGTPHTLHIPSRPAQSLNTKIHCLMASWE